MTKMQRIVPASHPFLSTAEDIINEARDGKMFVLVDDENPDNKGNLVMPAQMATPEKINFMATHGRGLICLALTDERVSQLELPSMNATNARLKKAFTVSIEAREGVTTGISAADRARTIAVAIDPANAAHKIVSPGHVFPLAARKGGVLMRAGATEGAVDFARLAGLNPSGVLCEVLNDNGTVARLYDLVPFAQRHGLKIVTIRDLIAYRHRHDHLLRRESEAAFDVDGASWKAISYRNTIDNLRHIALQYGSVGRSEPTPVRMHRVSLLDDVFGRPGSRQHLLQRAMKTIVGAGSGIVVLLRIAPETEFDVLLDINRPDDGDLRSSGVGAQILADLDIHEIELLTNTRRNIVAIDGWDIRIAKVRAF